MTDLDALATVRARPRWQECHVAYALRVLHPDDADSLRRALANDEVQHAEIARALRAEGVRVAGHTIGRHRNNGCTCEAGA
jgi:hypothetical protein